jgi:hypothetical protein
MMFLDSTWIENRPDLKFHLSGDTIMVGYSAHLGFSEDQAVDLRIPEEVFTAIPCEEFRKYLKKYSPLRRLGKE